VTPRTDANLAAALEQVVSEFRTAQPARKIDADIALTAPVAADDRRLAQLASNLIANALAHGDTAVPVRVTAQTVDDAFELSVSNAGTPIDPAMVERLFQPFTRASVRPGQQGLGLGLYIASEIARAHGGTLTVMSDETETRFTFRMPLCA
jgi:signal transduction histidine kinase